MRRLLCLLLLATPSAHAADAIYDAAHAAIVLKRAKGVRNQNAALSSAYDASPYRVLAAEPPRGRYGKRRSRLHAVPEDLRDALSAMPALHLEAPEPSVGARLSGAARAAFAPWRKLLAYAWDGAWGGRTPLRAWSALSDI